MRIRLIVLALALGAGGVHATELNCPQVRLITPYPAGGATDVASRLIAERLEPVLKRPVIVENRAGATGNIGTLAVVNAPADGCTLLNNAAVIATFTSSFTKLGYDPINDLVPIGGIGISPTLLVTATASPANDLPSLIAWSKSKPDGLNFSSAGYGLLQHIAVEEIASRSGGKFVHVAYRGGAQAVTDLIPGRVDFGSFAAGSVLPLVKEGKLKALAVVSDKRSELIPRRPPPPSKACPASMPACTSCCTRPPRRQGPGRAFVVGVEEDRRRPALKQRFINIGFDPTPTTSEEMVAVMRKTGEDWGPLIRRLNIKLD